MASSSAGNSSACVTVSNKDIDVDGLLAPHRPSLDRPEQSVSGPSGAGWKARAAQGLGSLADSVGTIARGTGALLKGAAAILDVLNDPDEGSDFDEDEELHAADPTPSQSFKMDTPSPAEAAAAAALPAAGRLIEELIEMERAAATAEDELRPLSESVEALSEPEAAFRRTEKELSAFNKAQKVRFANFPCAALSSLAPRVATSAYCPAFGHAALPSAFSQAVSVRLLSLPLAPFHALPSFPLPLLPGVASPCAASARVSFAAATRSSPYGMFPATSARSRTLGWRRSRSSSSGRS